MENQVLQENELLLLQDRAAVSIIGLGLTGTEYVRALCGALYNS
jgi:hypothetical protein